MVKCLAETYSTHATEHPWRSSLHRKEQAFREAVSGVGHSGRECLLMHGRQAPQVKRKAAERLADLIEPDRALRWSPYARLIL